MLYNTEMKEMKEMKEMEEMKEMRLELYPYMRGLERQVKCGRCLDGKSQLALSLFSRP